MTNETIVTNESALIEAIVAELMDYFDPLGGIGLVLTEGEARLIAFAAYGRLQHGQSTGSKSRETTYSVVQP